MKSTYSPITVIGLILGLFVFLGCDKDDNSIPKHEFVVRKDTINVHKTDVIATQGDNILKLVGDSLFMSNDLGNTWKGLKNTIGAITVVEWFSDRTCVICGLHKSYWVDESFSSINEAIVYDYDGSKLNDQSPHFFFFRRGHDHHGDINGKETFIWADYYGDVNGFISRVWQTSDGGKTVRCICKNGETCDVTGDTVQVRHFHDVIIRNNFDEIYITAGDYGKAEFIRGNFVNGAWHFRILGKGDYYKLCRTWIEEPYLYVVTDYTDGSTTGVLRINFENLCGETASIFDFNFVYKTPDNKPLVSLRKYGKYKFLGYDGSVSGRFLMSYDGGPFKTLSLLYDGVPMPDGECHKPNNAGLSIVIAGETGKGIYDLKLNDRMYDFTTAMHEAGYTDFGSN